LFITKCYGGYYKKHILFYRVVDSYYKSRRAILLQSAAGVY